MNKRIYLIISIIVLVILVGGTGGYIYLHSKEPIVKDSDGKNIYQKGFISKRTLFGYEIIEGDVCLDNNSVLEKFLWDENGEIGIPNRALFTYNREVCPNGCQEGVCLR